jgi:hypothetical protein
MDGRGDGRTVWGTKYHQVWTHEKWKAPLRMHGFMIDIIWNVKRAEDAFARTQADD